MHPPSSEPSLLLPLRWRIAAATLVLIAVLSALYVARTVMLPVALAILLSFLLSPGVEALRELRVPAALAAALVMLALLAVVGTAVVLLAEPAVQWFERLPELTARIMNRLRGAFAALRELAHVTERVEQFAGGGGPPTVQVQGSGLRGFLLNRTSQFVVGLVMMLFLLYFLLATGDLLLRKLVRVLPRFSDKRQAVKIAHHLQRDVTRYLGTVAVINTVLGAVVGSAMALLDMPNPVLWGVMAGVLNFIPYLGPLITLTVLTGVALLSFPELGQALLRPLTFFTLTTLEGQLVTPLILGRRLMLNPVVIFLGLIFWGWLWGIVGALLAVPITMSIKILCDAIPPLAPVGELMGR